uniref:Uncharacterized protein n=1 Tax=Laticauda laticaudata TaxID=8630 RepID=A0A8C5RLM4_LATLA
SRHDNGCILTLYNNCRRIRFTCMHNKYPDIDPSWYTGRGIRPVGRFGRRRAAAENAQKSDNRHLHACFPVEESSEFLQDE